MTTQEKYDKVLGSLIGFAIGDAMGATTEFMHPAQIKKKYGKVKDILGGGLFDWKQGEVTDDTQMMMCIIESIMSKPRMTPEDTLLNRVYFIKDINERFSEWLLSDPKDVGNACRNGILTCARDKKYFTDYDSTTLGNGSLMRALPFALIECKEMNVLQGRITHNNVVGDNYIRMYTDYIIKLIHNEDVFYSSRWHEPSGHVYNTFNNATLYGLSSTDFEHAITNPVNDGGDADTIAALSGGLAGALFGYSFIPEKWVNKIDKNVISLLTKFAKFVVEI